MNAHSAELNANYVEPSADLNASAAEQRSGRSRAMFPSNPRERALAIERLRHERRVEEINLHYDRIEKRPEIEIVRLRQWQGRLNRL